MERSGDEELVRLVIDGAVKERNEIIYSEIYVFDHLIGDYHLSDSISTCETQIIINLLLSCFTDQYILEDVSGYLMWLFFSLTKKGRELSGCKEDALLADYVANNWPELEEEFKGIENRLIEAYVNENISDIEEDYVFYGMSIVVDENERCYSQIKAILEILNFEEVVPGLFFYGALGYYGYDGCDICLSDYGLTQLFEIIAGLPKLRDLDKYDDALSVFDISVDGPNDYLFKSFGKKTSEMEVLF